MVIAARLARTWPMARIRLPPICSMSAKTCSTRARTLAMLWFRRCWHSERGWLRLPGYPQRSHHQPPLLLSAIYRSTKHAGQTQIYLTPMHAAHKKVERGIENIRRRLRMVRQTAEQYIGRSHWTLLVSYIAAQITQKLWTPPGGLSSPWRAVTAFSRLM